MSDDKKIDSKIIQQNLDEMIPYINEVLDNLPKVQKIYFGIDEIKYPKGEFLLYKNEKKIVLVPHVLKELFRTNIETAFDQTVGADDWGWNIKNPETDVDINDFEEEFEKQKTICYDKYNSEGKDLIYKLNFRYKVVASIESSPQETVSSKDKFYFTVRAVPN